MKTKYYIEICEQEEVGYILQTEWFDTEEEAMEWFEKISFARHGTKIFLMKSIFKDDDNYDCYTVARLN